MKQVNVRLNEELHKRLKLESIKDDDTLQNVIADYLLYGIAYVDTDELDTFSDVEDKYLELRKKYIK